MKKVFCLCGVFLLVGCRYYADPKSQPTFLKEPIQEPPPALITNTVPMPPGLPEQKVVRRQSIRALAIAPADKWIVVRWEQSPEPLITYILEVYSLSGPTLNHEHLDGSVTGIPQTKVEIVQLLKNLNTPPGWYRLKMRAENGLYLQSDPTTATTLFWKP